MSELPCGRGRHRSPRSVASPAQRPRRLSSAFVFPVGGLPTSCASGEYETGCAYGDERIDVGEGASGDVGGRVTHRVPATSGSRLLHRQWDTERGLPESHATCKDGKLVDLIVDAATWSRPLRAHVADGAKRPDLEAHSAPQPVVVEPERKNFLQEMRAAGHIRVARHIPSHHSDGAPRRTVE